MTQPFFNVRTVVGLTTVSRKNLSKRLDAVVKPRHNIAVLLKNTKNIAIFDPCNNACCS
ncbi:MULTISPECIES: hypothetical protein [unclassified Rickettsia]|uniref:hypothetical protein n=1 Tax=unclassified Rickettsia TaxID=114295 RepID=UPI003132B293